MANEQSWYVTAASVAGKGHIERGLPCQDAFDFTEPNKNWIVAALADGAGSQPHSEIGSNLACKSVIRLLKEAVLANNWHNSIELPSEKQVQIIVANTIQTILAELTVKASELNIEVKSLACTLMTVIATPNWLLGFQIGDGRACYQDKDQNWHPLFVPFKGEFANETVFITSAPLLSGNLDQYVNIFRFVGYQMPFALLSDGCEMHSFECHVVNSVTGHYSDPNKPFPGFFNPVLNTLRNLASKKSIAEVNKEWTNFLDQGTDGFRNESDDKTMLIAFWR